MMDSDFVSADSISELIFSAGFASTNGKSTISIIGRFAVVRFHQMVLWNWCKSAEPHH